MDVTAEDILHAREDGFRLIGKEDLGLAAAFLDELFIIVHIVHAGERMKCVAERLAVFFLSQYVAVRIDTGILQQFLVKEMVSDFVRRVAEHERDLLHTGGDAAQHDGKAVPGEDRENDADMVAAEFRFHVIGNVLHRRIVAGGAGHNRLRHGDDVAVVEGDMLRLGGGHDAVAHQRDKIVALPDDGGTDAANNSTNSSHNEITSEVLDFRRYYATIPFVCKDLIFDFCNYSICVSQKKHILQELP